MYAGQQQQIPLGQPVYPQGNQATVIITNPVYYGYGKPVSASTYLVAGLLNILGALFVPGIGCIIVGASSGRRGPLIRGITFLVFFWVLFVLLAFVALFFVAYAISLASVIFGIIYLRRMCMVQDAERAVLLRNGQPAVVTQSYPAAVQSQPQQQPYVATPVAQPYDPKIPQYM